MINKKDAVLKKIREALIQPTPLPFPRSEGQSPLFTPLSQDLEVEFAEQFTSLQGKFAFCLNERDLVRQIYGLVMSRKWSSVYCVDEKLGQLLSESLPLKTASADLPDCDVAVTGCEFLVARTGSIVLSAADASGRNTSVYAPIHICIAYSSQLVYDIRDALEGMQLRYGSQLPSLISFATGPSRTADIEKTLVVGVHGPGEVYVFLVNDLTNE